MNPHTAISGRFQFTTPRYSIPKFTGPVAEQLSFLHSCQVGHVLWSLVPWDWGCCGLHRWPALWKSEVARYIHTYIHAHAQYSLLSLFSHNGMEICIFTHCAGTKKTVEGSLVSLLSQLVGVVVITMIGTVNCMSPFTRKQANERAHASLTISSIASMHYSTGAELVNL